MNKCFIALENGTVYEGVRFGAPTDAIGEIVFNTTMGGHMKTLTDPVNSGQIVIQTFPTVGNYGVISSEMDSSRCHLSGYVVREWCEAPVNHRSEGDIDSFLKLHGVAGVYGVDTRQIARIIREYGPMNAAIADEVTPELLQSLKVHKATGAMQRASMGNRAVHPAVGEPKYRVALINYGAPHGVIADLCKRGAAIHELPFDASAEEVRNLAPDALVLSDGPGDPMDAAECVAQLKLLLGVLPILGIGQGHLLLALAAGGQTEKLNQGHRGANQPIRRLSSGQTYISALNQGYAVSKDALPNQSELSYINVGDQGVAGLLYRAENAMSIQFVPDGTLGPLRTDFVYDEFLGKVLE